MRLLAKGDAQLREVAAALLGTIALHPRGRSRVLAAGAVPALVKLLPLRHEPTQEAAARARGSGTGPALTGVIDQGRESKVAYWCEAVAE